MYMYIKSAIYFKNVKDKKIRRNEERKEKRREKERRREGGSSFKLVKDFHGDM